jgi:RNA polymerase primary sigma factor/RNA polymerase sigma factor
MPESDTPARKVRRPADLPPYLASLYEMPLLTREQEQHIFRKYNFLKYRANKLREELDPAAPKSSLMDEIEALYQQAIETKNEIARANLRLVVSIAKRHVTPDQNFFELVSDGNVSLLRAVEKFDFARGNKFSTYASWAIMKNFARTIPGEFKHRDRYRTSQDELFAATPEYRADHLYEEGAQLTRQAQVEKILRRLDEREQKIIMGRFGLQRGHEPQTLKEVGASLGVTKERIRQIEARALSKLRLAAQEEKIALE